MLKKPEHTPYDYEEYEIMRSKFLMSYLIEKYNYQFFKDFTNQLEKQYNNIKFINNDPYHDRFIIIDRKIVFHSGASFKDLGKKCFAINEIENKIENSKLINDVIKNCSIDN